jgi:Zn-dependent protease with chaperone function
VLDYAGQAIVHAAVASVVIESLLRLWHTRHADERLALRLLALVLPLVLPVAFALAAPFRHDDGFGARWALFAGEHWNQLRVGGIGLWTLIVTLLGFSGAVLCLRDLVGFLIDRVRRDPRVPGPQSADAAQLRSLLGELAHHLGVEPPSIVLLALDAPVLLCAGVLRPTLVVSLGALRRLEPDELRAALTHELAHVSHRDTLMGWTLMGLRLLQVFNPIAQIVGRQAVQEIERRADAAVAATGQHDGLARALIKLSARRDDDRAISRSERLGLSERLAAKAALSELDGRCDRLLSEDARSVPGANAARVAMAAAGLAALLFFVV